MSIGRYLASLVVVSGALVLASTASAAGPSVSSSTSIASSQSAHSAVARSSSSVSADAMRERKLADAKVALKGDNQRVVREKFNSGIGYLSYVTSIRTMNQPGADRAASNAIKSFTENTAAKTFSVQANKPTVHSAWNTQATVTAKALVQAVGPARAKAYAKSMVDSTKKSVQEGSSNHHRSDIGNAYRFQRAVDNVVSLGVTKK